MRIAVFSFGSLGHVTPVVPLVHAAMEAGHEVRVLTELDGVAVFEQFGIPSVGIDHSGGDEEREAQERLRTDASTPAGDLQNPFSYGFVSMGQRALPIYVEELRAFEADVLLRHRRLGGDARCRGL